MVTNQLRNKVAGLCGNFNGSPLDDNLSRSKTPIVISGPTGANGLSALASSFHYTDDDTQVVVSYHSCVMLLYYVIVVLRYYLITNV